MTRFPYPMTIAGLGLRLREWTAADVPVMVELFDNAEVGRWTPLSSPFDEAAARAYLDRAGERRAGDRAVQLAVTTDGHTPLGEILLFAVGPDGRDAGGPDAELGYAIGPAYRGQGLATRAVRLMTGHAYRELGVRRVVLRIDLGNDASERVARATGFRPAAEPAPGGEAELRTWVHENG
ncbi:MAG TPA: GNAT family N-acetyltransferase [Actinophytocola sp.]|nr:GNAT family N-acetyltransferase [Actinophytocola sp.]